VPPVRQWLTRKQRETRCGRAELRLATITSLWRERPESRRLPSLLEWLMIVGLTPRGRWSDDESRMMRAATRHVLLRAAAAVLIVGAMAGVIAVARQRERAANLLAGAVDADYRHLPSLIPELERYRDAFRQDLVALEANAGAPLRRREVARILLYRDRPTAALGADLRRRLTAPQAQPEEVEVICGALAAHPGESGSGSLRRVLTDEEADPAARLRAACALQAMVRTSTIDPDLRAAAPALAEALLVEPRREFPRWLELLGPAAEELVPHLVAIRRDTKGESYARSAAAAALAYALGRGDRDLELARNIVEAAPMAAKVLLREFDDRKPSTEALEFLRGVASEAVSDDRERHGQDELADRQAAAVAALAALGEFDRLWPQLVHRADPRVRSLLIQRLVDAVPSQVLIERLAQPGLDTAECQALLLAWAEARRGAAPASARAQVAERARRLYLEHPDPGVHSAAGLLLRRWDEARFVAQADRDVTAPLVGPDGRGWERGPNGHTLAILPAPLRFRMGSPPHEEGRLDDQALHYRKIDRSLAVSMTEVTLEQFLALEQERPLAPGAGEHGPVAGGIDWFRAVRYCNRLSRAAGMDPSEWCYPEKTGDIQVVPADAVYKEGFRLPTEAEWEYICRAGAETARPFGESQQLLPHYAWTWLNSDDRPHPVGQLLPNEFGMFDILGNVWEWCQDGPAGGYPEVPLPPYPPGTPEHPASDPVRREDAAVSDGREATWRILRGGSFNYAPVKARSAHRDWIPADYRRSFLGFRVVRTLRRPPLGTAPPNVAAWRVEAVARPGGP
jgi:formylglycine-generating enzyme required for sulfatase activity